MPAHFGEGRPQLVEEASIGVAAGEEPYMLADIVSIVASEERIFLLETNPPVIRVYDMDGKHVKDIGSEGQGPGELAGPMSMVPYDSEGVAGEAAQPPEIEYEAPELPEIVRTLPNGNRSISRLPIPFYPLPVAIISPMGGWVVGVGDRYRFEVRYFGGTVTVVERILDPVAVSADEAAWRKRSITASMRRSDAEWSWTGPDVPDHKPFFDQLHADQSGRVWARRSGQSTHVEDCDEYPDYGGPDEPPKPVNRCWEATSPIFDAFGADGRYLGEVESPPGHRVSGFGDPYIRDDMIVLQIEDDAGTIVVKRYRLVLPGEEA